MAAIDIVVCVEEEEDIEEQRQLDQLKDIVYQYSQLAARSRARLSDQEMVEFTLSADIFSSKHQSLYGFLPVSDLLHVKFILTNYQWNRRPQMITVRHPTLQNRYSGHVLISQCTNDFFSSNYHPKSSYKSQALIVSSVDDPAQPKNNLPDYGTCPLLYLALELADAFLALEDHCCLCRLLLGENVKPSVCSSPLCNFQANEIRIGRSVVQEIQRDPLVADFLVSLFLMASENNFLRSEPPQFDKTKADISLKNLPPMESLAKMQSDLELTNKIGHTGWNLLHWILFSNHLHFISVPDSIPKTLNWAVSSDYKCFMVIPSKLEREEIFQGIDKQVGHFHGWHGSSGERWHVIIHKGLEIKTGTPDEANGDLSGPGISFAPDAKTSWVFTKEQPIPNEYTHSVLGKTLRIISLCEIANVPSHRKIAVPLGDRRIMCQGSVTPRKPDGANVWAWRLTMEKGCAVRFLFVKESLDNKECFSWDVRRSPIRIPNVTDILRMKREMKSS
jgi:hypothetical protein